MIELRSNKLINIASGRVRDILVMSARILKFPDPNRGQKRFGSRGKRGKRVVACTVRTSLRLYLNGAPH